MIHLCKFFSVVPYMLTCDLPARLCAGLYPVCFVSPSWRPMCAVLLTELSWQAHKFFHCSLNQGSEKFLGKCLASIFAGSTHQAIILEVEISLTSWCNFSTCNSWHGWLNHHRLNRQYSEQMVNNLQKVKLWAGLRLNFMSYLSYCHRSRLAALNHRRLYSIYKMNFKSFKSKWDKAEFLELG